MGRILACKALCKQYRGIAVLNDVSFELDAGEALIVTGPNGSGKTTLLSVLAGLLQAEGELLLREEILSPAAHRLRRQIGFAPASENNLFLNASVRENLTFWARLQSLKAAPIDESARQWGFAAYLDRPVHELSSGFRRRVALARAFLHSPSLVVLDEPFAFLDNENRNIVLGVLENWLKAERGALVVSSNLDFAKGESWKSLNL